MLRNSDFQKSYAHKPAFNNNVQNSLHPIFENLIDEDFLKR